MKLKSFANAVITTALGLIMAISCTEPDNGPVINEEPRTNLFTFDGYSFDINSAVQYDKGDSNIEIWLSPTSGLTTSREIKASGDYVVLNTHKSFLGGRDRFNSQTSKESYIRFCDQKFAYGNEGTAYIETDIVNDSLKVMFLVERFHTRNSPVPVAILSGEYKGTFTVEKEKPYADDWGYDREHTAIEEAVFTTREDGGNASFTLYEANGIEAIRIEMPESSIGKEFLLTASDTPADVKLYVSRSRYTLKGAVGMIRTSIKEESAEISISLLKDDSQLRAEYSGEYETDVVKLNRFIYDYEGDSGYEGRQTIVKFMVEDKGTFIRLFFSPGEGYTISNANSTHMPILTVPTSIINAGKKTFMELEGWEFAYDMMQSWPYENEYKPHPSYSDWIEINREGMEYEVEFILTSQATGMQPSTIDLYYKGKAQ